MICVAGGGVLDGGVGGGMGPTSWVLSSRGDSSPLASSLSASLPLSIAGGLETLGLDFQSAAVFLARLFVAFFMAFLYFRLRSWRVWAWD